MKTTMKVCSLELEELLTSKKKKKRETLVHVDSVKKGDLSAEKTFFASTIYLSIYHFNP